MSAHEQIIDLKARMERSIIGQEQVVERLLLTLLCNGNVLVEGLPGLAKTRAVKSLAKNMEADFSRIQFTPDLLPADITGVSCECGEVTARVFDRYRVATYEEAEHKPYVMAAMILLARFRDPAGVLTRVVERAASRKLTV